MAKKTTKVVRKLEPADKKYEIMIVLQPEMLESAVEKKLKDLDKFLTENGGTVDMRDVWGKQKMAYRIKGNNEGIYVVYNITYPTTENAELDEHLRIDKDVIRHLVITLEDDYAYKKFEEEAPKKEMRKEKEEAPGRKRTSTATHKAASKEPMETEVKDKGKKVSADVLDDKLDKLLGDDDLNI